MPPKKSGKPAPSKKSAPKKKPTGNKKEKGEKQIKVPKIVVPNFEVSEDVEIDEEDIEFFKENSQLSGFLSKMDTVKLAKNEIIKAKKKTTMGALKKGPVEQTADDVASESDNSGDDSDLENMEIDMDSDDEPMSEEDFSDMEDGHYETMGGAAGVDSDSEDERIVDSDDEQDYEQAPRKAEGWSEKGSTRLPIKLADGRIKEVEDNRVRPSEKKDDDSEEEVVDSDFAEEEGDQDETVFEEEEEEEAKPAKKIPKKVVLAQKKEEMATIAQTIIADPEANVGQLKKLRAMAQDPSDVIKKLALLTQLAVYKDILPGYRIRPLSEKEQSVTVSKEVAKLRDYEQSLLLNYQHYLQSLEKVLAQDKSGKEEEEAEAAASKGATASLTAPVAAAAGGDDAATKKAKADMATVAIHCMCNLLTSVTHFNFRLNLMTALIARMSRRHWSELSETCSKALKEVFTEDEAGEVSLDAVKLITKMIKSKSYLVHPNVISAFLSLRLKEELPTRASGDEDNNPRKRKKKEKVHISKKNRKLLKAKKEVEVEMKEAEAVVDKEEKMRMQTETLKLVFITYFRILKHAPGSPLLPAVLEGLAKFAHLINVDFFTDLLEVLKKIMVGGADAHQFDNFTPANRRTQLLCIVTAFQLLQGQGEALNIDLKAFYNEFYTSLLTVAMNPDIEGNIFEAADAAAKEKERQKLAAKSQWKGKNAKKLPGEEEVLVVLSSDRELILKGFELLFFSTKGKIPVIRAASFLKRIAVASLQFPNKSMKDFLAIMKKLVQKQPQLDQLLTGTDEDRAGNGVYHPALNDPELCNPMAASLWEFELMKSHFDPKVRQMARELAAFTPSAGMRTHDRTINH
ncbi:hypothetical protein BGZ88_009726 [Linnemannia elongata]|nr:hypothetical protein BGZ88_009726 [Linnemannia elongata]KAG0060563.1 hypothetical protein BGZ89_012180 [Linnemannia elongata]KAK5828021.1 nucleolar complex-associated protein-domain-containing protein [Linnemannia elongata]